MTYDLRRLRLHGLIERIPRSHRYQVTPEGMRIALFFTRAHVRFFRTGLSLESPLPPTRASRALVKASEAVDQLIQEVKLAA
jgi:Mn-dependent DtxR family transcriptional regulator